MPIYNEEEIIEKVVVEWLEELNRLNINYKMFAYNDGSKDNTKNILDSVAQKYPNLIVINQENSWHGPTILKGYKTLSSDFSWIFQVDADNEMTAEKFHELWENRTDNDLIMVIRTGRLQSFARKIISLISRLTVKLFYGKSPWDVNSPYRLMRCEKFKNLFLQLPDKTLSPNMVLAGLAAKKKFRIYEQSVPCSMRKTGRALSSFKLLKTSIKSFWQTFIYAFIVK